MGSPYASRSLPLLLLQIFPQTLPQLCTDDTSTNTQKHKTKKSQLLTQNKHTQKTQTWGPRMHHGPYLSCRFFQQEKPPLLCEAQVSVCLYLVLCLFCVCVCMYVCLEYRVVEKPACITATKGA